MDREGMGSKRNDEGDGAVLELTATGRNSEVVAASIANELGREIKSAPSKDVEVQSLLAHGERENEQPRGGRKGSTSFRLNGRQYSESKKVKRFAGKEKKVDGLGEKRGAMMVVSVLIATVTYQAALNPPGGFWQDDENGLNTAPATRNDDIGDGNYQPPPPPSDGGHLAGTAVNRNIPGFQFFLIANTVGLFSSLVNILLLSSVITIKRQIMMWVLMFIMWVSVFSVAFSFFCGALIILRNLKDRAIQYIVGFALCCALLLALLVILHIVVGLRRINRWAKKKPSHSAEEVQSH